MSPFCHVFEGTLNISYLRSAIVHSYINVFIILAFNHGSTVLLLAECPTWLEDVEDGLNEGHNVVGTIDEEAGGDAVPGRGRRVDL